MFHLLTMEREETDKGEVNFNGGETRFAFGGEGTRKKKILEESEGETFVEMDIGRFLLVH